jgi:hypothetical protein
MDLLRISELPEQFLFDVHFSRRFVIAQAYDAEFNAPASSG